MNNDDSLSAGRRASPLDHAIDRAVRDMMHVDPPAGLRRRVLTRIEALSSPRPMLFARHAFAAAALAALVLAVLVMREKPPPTGRRETPPAIAHATPPAEMPRASEVPAQRQPAGGQRLIAPGTPTPGTPKRVSPKPVSDEPIVMPRVANVFGARGGGVTAANAAAAGDDMVFASATEPGIQIEPLAGIPQITVTPLRIDPLHIDPLSPRR